MTRRKIDRKMFEGAAHRFLKATTPARTTNAMAPMIMATPPGESSASMGSTLSTVSAPTVLAGR